MKKKILRILIILAVVLALVAVGLIIKTIIKNMGKTYNSYTVKNEAEMNGNATAEFLIGDEMVLRYTRDGVSAFNETGKEIWNVSYEMNNPVIDVNGQYAAVADKGSDKLYIMDGTGSVHKLETEHPIEKVSVSNLGVTAVWMNGGLKDYITIYKIDGKKITDMMTTTSEAGIPLAMDMSYDGTKLVTSYVAVKDGQLENRLSFYNFGEYGANYVDRLVGFKSYADRNVADVRFIDSEHVVAFSTKGVNIFEIDVKEQEVANIDITDKIEQVSAGSEYIGVVTSSDSGARTAHIYNLKGQEEENIKLDINYSSFKIKKKELIFYDSNNLYIKRVGGNDKAKLTLEMDVDGVFTDKAAKTYLIIGEQALQQIELSLKEDK